MFLLLVATGNVHVTQSDREKLSALQQYPLPPSMKENTLLSICENSALIGDLQSQFLRINNVAKDCMRGLESLIQTLST